MRTAITAEDIGTANLDQQFVILVVDDEPGIRLITSEILLDQGFQIIEAVDGEEALAILRDEPEIGFLLTDINMPRLDGVALAASARTINPDIKILLVTGGAPRGGIHEALLRKPYSRDQLVAAATKTFLLS